MATGTAPKGASSIRTNRRANANPSTNKSLIDYDSSNPAWGDGSPDTETWAPRADTNGTGGRAPTGVPIATSEAEAGNHG